MSRASKKALGPLTARQAWVLARLEDGEELVYERGAGGWVDLDRVAARTVFALLGLMAITLTSDPRDVGRHGCLERYTISEVGSGLLEQRLDALRNWAEWGEHPCTRQIRSTRAVRLRPGRELYHVTLARCGHQVWRAGIAGNGLTRCEVCVKRRDNLLERFAQALATIGERR